MTLIANPADSISLERVINEPKRGIGSGSLDKLRDFANYNNWSELEAAQNAEIANDLTGRAQNAIVSFGETIRQLQEDAKKMNVTELTEQVLEKTGYMAALKASKSLESESRIENLESFVCYSEIRSDVDEEASEAGSQLADFLSDLALVSDQDNVDENQNKLLMTLHAAKGLEFPVIFLVD